MGKFDGKNSETSVRRLAAERAEYVLEAFPENGGMGPVQVMDFNFAERTLYGRVDRQHNPVIPRNNFIVPATGPDGGVTTILLMNFVALQWRDLQRHFISAVRLGILPGDDPHLSKLVGYHGYEDPKQMYSIYLEEMLHTYTFEFLADRVHQIKSFDNFLQFFPHFMTRMRDRFPVSFSGFQRSNNSSIFTSGLAIDIANIPFDNDPIKEQLLLTSPIFSFYMEVAKNYGFSVNKLNPGVLVCDLESPATVPYRNKYNIPNLKEIFARQYEKTIYSDIEELIKILVIAYNAFVRRYPHERTITVKGDGTSHCWTHVQLHEKQQININNINNNIYNSVIKLYINIRNIEERTPYNQNALDIIIRNALRIRKISETKMLDYIDDQFKAKYNLKKGSLTYHTKRNRLRLDK